MRLRNVNLANRLNPPNEALGLGPGTSRRLALAVVWAKRLLVVFALAYCTRTFTTEPGFQVGWDVVVWQGLGVLATFLTATRAIVERGRFRLIWGLFAVAQACFVGASCWLLTYRFRDIDPPIVGFSDIAVIVFYPLTYASVTLLMRSRVRQVPRSIWLDGAVGALACAALALVFEYDAIISGATDETPLASAVVTAVPVADIVLVALLLALLPVSNWRPDRMWRFLALGLTLNAAGDTMLMLTTTGYDVGTPMDIPWVLAWLCFGLAPWQKVDETRKRATESQSIVAMPMIFAIISLGVLFAGAFTEVALVAQCFAVVGVLLGLLRMGLTFREIRALAESRQQARTDELTELGNRRFFYEQTASMLRGRASDKPFAVIVIDLDRFKEINDSLGHLIGDSLLRQLGPRFMRGASKDTLIARLGGDEFAVVVDGATAAEALVVAQQLSSSLKEPFVLDGVPVEISASVGISLFPDHAKDPDGLLQHADVAMYSAKREHTGPQVYTPGRDLHTKERLRSIHELRRSIEQGRLIMHYQPQVNSNTGGLVGCEALVRLTHPTRGMIPPDEFLPLAEQAGLMRLLTTEVLRLVLDDCVRWREAGHPGLKVSINLSVTNLLDVNFPSEVATAVAARGLDARQLVFEVTEGTMLSDLNRAQEAATSLRSLGCEMSLDDYGTGYASLAYLRKFPLDELKLDRSFVAELDSDSIARTFVRSANDVAHALGIRVVAEGIETQEIWDAVRDSGGDICQGYFFSKPMSSDDFMEKVVRTAIRLQSPSTLG